MKKAITYSIILIGLLTGCNDDFMDRYPLSAVSPQTYFKTEAELQTYINGLYNILPGAEVYSGDVQSDNLAPKSYNIVVAGQHQVETDAAEAGWTWDYLRDVNFFLENYQRAKIDQKVRDHYAGVARFFRAWFYFDKMKHFGDVPWYGQTLSNTDEELLYKGRDSRLSVTDSIMADLDFATSHIYEVVNGNTINRWTALALQSRVALYEGTYRKYHSLSGADALLEIAYLAAETVVKSGVFSLYKTGNPNKDYVDLFVMDQADTKEIILAREYDSKFNQWHTANGTFLTGTLAAPGLTRSLVNTYLMADGSRFTDIPGHKSMTFKEETANRDPRLAQTMRTPGYMRIGTTTALAPNFDNARTGYQCIKFVMGIQSDGFSQNANDLPVFRYAEVLLNFAEAKAELGILTQADIDLSINLLRARAGMPGMVFGNLTVDPILAGQHPNVTNNTAAILEIRRERRVELAIEGFRYDDLMRWKAGNLLAEPFTGMYIPNTGKVDIDGDGLPDVAFVTEVPSPAENIQYLILGSGFKLENETEGQIIMHPTINKVFEDPKHYLFPLPRTEILLNPALTQNTTWE